VPNLEILTSGENTHLTYLQPTDLEGAVHRSLQLHHGVTEFLEHTSNDSITSLFDAYFDPRRVVVVAHDSCLGLHETIRETDTLSELIERDLRNTPLNSSLIDTLKPEARVH
jgi:hypothetical protein